MKKGVFRRKPKKQKAKGNSPSQDLHPREVRAQRFGNLKITTRRTDWGDLKTDRGEQSPPPSSNDDASLTSTDVNATTVPQGTVDPSLNRRDNQASSNYDALLASTDADTTTTPQGVVDPSLTKGGNQASDVVSRAGDKNKVAGTDHQPHQEPVVNIGQQQAEEPQGPAVNDQQQAGVPQGPEVDLSHLSDGEPTTPKPLKEGTESQRSVLTTTSSLKTPSVDGINSGIINSARKFEQSMDSEILSIKGIDKSVKLFEKGVDSCSEITTRTSTDGDATPPPQTVRVSRNDSAKVARLRNNLSIEMNDDPHSKIRSTTRLRRPGEGEGWKREPTMAILPPSDPRSGSASTSVSTLGSQESGPQANNDTDNVDEPSLEELRAQEADKQRIDSSLSPSERSEIAQALQVARTVSRQALPQMPRMKPVLSYMAHDAGDHRKEWPDGTELRYSITPLSEGQLQELDTEYELQRADITRASSYAHSLEKAQNDPDRSNFTEGMLLSRDDWINGITSYPNAEGDLTDLQFPEDAPHVHRFLSVDHDEHAARKDYNTRCIKVAVFDPLLDRFKGPLLKDCYASFSRPLDALRRAVLSPQSPQHKVTLWEEDIRPDDHEAEPRLLRYIAEVGRILDQDPNRQLTRFGLDFVHYVFREVGDSFHGHKFPTTLKRLVILHGQGNLSDFIDHLCYRAVADIRDMVVVNQGGRELNDHDLQALAGIVLVISLMYDTILRDLVVYLHHQKAPDLDSAPWVHPVYMARRLATHFTGHRLLQSVTHVQKDILPYVLSGTTSETSQFRFYDILDPAFDRETPNNGRLFSQTTYVPLANGYPASSRKPPSPDKHTGSLNLARLREKRGNDGLPPLEYPHIPPYKALTHYDGRWVEMPLGDSTIPHWVNYTNGVPTKLASNTPTIEQRPDHWINRQLPSGEWTTKHHSGIPLPYPPKTLSHKPICTTGIHTLPVHPYWAEVGDAIQVPADPFVTDQPLKPTALSPTPRTISSSTVTGSPQSDPGAVAPAHDNIDPTMDIAAVVPLRKTVRFDETTHVASFDRQAPITESFVPFPNATPEQIDRFRRRRKELLPHAREIEHIIDHGGRLSSVQLSDICIYKWKNKKTVLKEIMNRRVAMTKHRGRPYASPYASILPPSPPLPLQVLPWKGGVRHNTTLLFPMVPRKIPRKHLQVTTAREETSPRL